MSDENIEEGQEAPQTNPVEDEARAHGWRPKEEFEADEKNAGKKWRTADDFMDRKSLFDKIDAVTTDNRNLKKGIQTLAEHNAKVEEAAYKRALESLKAERKQALEDADLVRAEEIRDEIDEVKEKIVQVKNVQPVVPEAPPALVEWKAQNQWYQKDEVMTVYADAVGVRLHQNGMPPELVLKEVERRVRENFPDRFRNPNKDVAPKVEVGGKRSGGSGFRLTEDEERAMNAMIRAGAPITRDKYIEDLKKLRGQ